MTRKEWMSLWYFKSKYLKLRSVPVHTSHSSASQPMIVSIIPIFC